MNNELLSLLLLMESIFLGIFLMFTLMGYPRWLKIAFVKIKGNQYVIKLTRDNALVIEGAKEEEGVYRTKTGIYELEPEDSFSFNGSTAGLWYAPYNRAVLARVMPILRDLKKFGIDHYGQLMYYYNTPLEQIKQESGETAAEAAEVIKGYEGKILQDLEIIRISDLKNFLESRSPSAENAVIERYVSIERRKLGNPFKNTNVILFIVMAGILGLCLGYIIAGGNQPGAVQTMGNAAGTLTQIT